MRGLRGLRSALTVGHGALDRGAPQMETQDLTVPSPAGPMRARLYRPDAAAHAPGAGLVFFHGGGFVICDLETHDGLCRYLAHSSGMRIISIDYRLAP